MKRDIRQVIFILGTVFYHVPSFLLLLSFHLVNDDLAKGKKNIYISLTQQEEGRRLPAVENNLRTTTTK